MILKITLLYYYLILYYIIYLNDNSLAAEAQPELSRGRAWR